MRNMFDELKRKMTYMVGQNNYNVNTLWVTLYEDGLFVESGYINPYGSVWGNEDAQFISWVDLPNWVGRKLLSLDNDYTTISK